MNSHKMVSVAKGPSISGNLPGSSRPDSLRHKFPNQQGEELWSPCSSSSDENNSPTALNSYNWDKPALEDKSVNFGWCHTKTNGNLSSTESRNSGSSSNVLDEKRPKDGYANIKSSERMGCSTLEKKILPNQGTHIGAQTCSARLSEFCQERDPATDVVESDDATQDTCFTERSEEDVRKEKEELKNVAWFQAGIPREIALEVLQGQEEGSFIVRESSTRPGCFALSLRVPPDKNPAGIAHYLILRTKRGYKIKGFVKEFGTLTALITHHSVMPEMLPCPLSLNRPSRRDAEREFEDAKPESRDIFEDIHWLMTDLEL